MSTLLMTKVTELTIGEVFATSVVCFAFILCVLALLIGVIILMRLCLNKIEGISANKKQAKATASDTTVAVASQPTATTKQEAKGSSGGINIYNVEPKDAAMVMAIVADELKLPLNQIRFKSIKYIGTVDQNSQN